MGIDLDLFTFQLSDLEVSRWLLSGGIEALKRDGALTGFIAATSGIPGPQKTGGPNANRVPVRAAGIPDRIANDVFDPDSCGSVSVFA